MVLITTTRKTTKYKTVTAQALVQKTGPPGKNSVGHIVIPYIQGLGGSFKKTCGKYRIQTHFKGNRTLKQLLVNTKDQDPKETKSGVIYSNQCGEIMCNEEYIGKISRTLGEDTGSTSRNPPHPCTQPTNWTQFHTGQFQHHRKGGPGLSQDYKGIYLHQGKQSHA